MDEDIPYLLLTPGPLTTSRTVRQTMTRDYCTWDDEYNNLVQEIRRRLERLAGGGEDTTSVLMQGSGTFGVEALLGTILPPDGKLLVLDNGAYGRRMVQIAERLRIDHRVWAQPETEWPRAERVAHILAEDPRITHVAMVHCETTTGMLNPATEIGAAVRRAGRIFLLDAMSSFGGIPFTLESMHADFLVSSANKCIQGVPGFSFVLGRRSILERSKGWARSLSLDLHDQWREMEDKGGKWRYTSPTHVVRAFLQALEELEAEGGVQARHQRYQTNQRILVEEMERLGFQTLLPREVQSPIITSFLIPKEERFTFARFYAELKARRFVVYPGKVTHAETFRIGNIGHVFPDDMRQLGSAVADACRAMGLSLGQN